MRKSLGIVGAAVALALSAAPASAGPFLTVPAAGQLPPTLGGTGQLSQTGALGTAEQTPGTCAQPAPAEPPSDTASRYYDGYADTNRTDQTQCVTVELNPQSCVADPNQIQSAAYVPSFNPAAIETNFVSDIGAPPQTASQPATYSFNVPPGSRFEVVVSAVTASPTGVCGGYGLTLSSDKPWVIGLPTIGGSLVTGEILSVTSTWSSPASVIARSWQRCDASGAACTDIPGAGGATYVPTEEDIGHALRVVESAADPGYPNGTSATGPATLPVQSGRPRPAYVRSHGTGAIERGDTLLAGSNADDALLEFAPPFPVDFFGTSYTNLLLSVNGNIQLEGVNRTTDWERAALPTDRLGTAILGHWGDLITTRAGEGIFASVTGAPPNRVLHLEWRANIFTRGGEDVNVPANDPVNFEVRLHESSPTISLVYGAVTGSGSNGTAGIQGAPFGPFADQFPYALSPGLQIDYTGSRPSIAGTAQEGSELTGSDATWVGPGPITSAFQWLSCDANGEACSEIAGATGPRLVPTGAQAGYRVRLRVTASNDRGSTSLVSPPTAPVAGVATPDRTAPYIHSLRVSNRAFRVARGITPVTAQSKSKIKRGTNVLSNVSEAGTARYTVQRERRGRQVGKRCLKSTRKRRKRKRCYRYENVQTYTRGVKAGRNTFWFTGRVGTLALIPDRYRVVMRVKDAAGNEARNRWVRFRITG